MAKAATPKKKKAKPKLTDKKQSERFIETARAIECVHAAGLVCLSSGWSGINVIALEEPIRKLQPPMDP